MELIKSEKIVMKRDTPQIAIQLSFQNQNHSEKYELENLFSHSKRHVMQLWNIEDFDK